MKKIGIIGANSYIARNVIYILDRINKESSELQYDISLYDFADKQIDNFNNYTKINILDSDSIKIIDMNCDLLFMFVGKTGSADGFNNYNTFIDINEKALLNILTEYVRQESTAKIIFPSTRLVYRGSDSPQTEDAEKDFKTIYAINKWACENYLKMYHNVYNVQYCIFRICIPYGTLVKDASSYGTAEFMLKKAKIGENITLYGDGAVKRTLTHMEDLCNTLIQGSLNSNCVNDVYNIGGETYSLNEMARLIANKYNVQIDYIPYPDIAKKIESGSTVFNDKKLVNIIGNTIYHKFGNWIQSQN